MEETLMYLIGSIITIVVIAVLAIFSPRYTVVPAHEAHVVVTRKGRKLYCSTKEIAESEGSTYWHVPLLHRRNVLPLENVKLVVEDISMRDKDVAKFEADVRVWVCVKNPILASEKLGEISKKSGVHGFPSIEADIKDLIEAVTRNSGMKMDVFQMMREREKFSQEIEDQIAPILERDFGIRIADLEVIHFTDMEGYTVIKDLEKRQSVVISAETRKLVATKEKEAFMTEEVARQDKETKKVEVDETLRKREITKDREVGLAEQDKFKEIQIATGKVNEETVKTKRIMDEGNAKIQKDTTVIKAQGDAQSVVEKARGDSEAVIQKAKGDANAVEVKGKADANIVFVKGEADAKIVALKGSAEAKVVKEKLLAEAEGIDKKATALKLYNEAGLSIEIINADLEAKKAYADALSKGLEKASLHIVQSGEGKTVFGIPLNAETGANFASLLVALKEQGINVDALLEKLPIPETLRSALAIKLGKDVVRDVEKETKGK